ncbi:MAG: GTPase Era [Desulfomonilaceae bacterium]
MEQKVPDLVKAGFVAVIGLPNVGKSTLVNRLTNSELSIVSSKAQTTRNSVSLILTLPHAQIIFRDTPGFHEATTALNQALIESVLRTLRMTDIAILLVDSTAKADEQSKKVQDLVALSKKPVILAINKIDTVDLKLAEALVSERLSEGTFARVIAVSAKTGQNCDLLLNQIVEILPEGPYLYSPDDLSDMPTRFFAAEIIREQILKLLSQEIPHKTAITIETFQESDKRILIQANVHVERDSQKKILIGRSGSMVKTIGTFARKKLEEFLEKSVRLELFIKVSKDWTKDTNKLREFGYMDN